MKATPRVFCRIGLGTAMGVLLMQLSGCASTPSSSFYILHGPKMDATQETSVPRSTLGLLPVSLPEFINRPQLVTKTANGQVRIDQFNRWAEPLMAGCNRVLQARIQSQVSGIRVMRFPWVDQSPDLFFSLEVQNFVAEPGKQVTLSADCTLYQGHDEVLSFDHVELSVPVAKSPQSVVDAMSEALIQLGDHLVRMIQDSGVVVGQ